MGGDALCFENRQTIGDMSFAWTAVGALRGFVGVVNEPFAVINADDFYGKDAYVTLHDFLAGDEIGKTNGDKLHYAMVGFKLSNTLTENGSVARGICQANDAGNLIKIEDPLAKFP